MTPGAGGVIANVVLPAPSAAYFTVILFPVAAVLALVSECAVYAWATPSSRRAEAVGIAIVVNIVSWFAGVWLTSLLPDGSMPTLTAVLSFPLACALSFGIEFSTLYPFRRHLPFRRLARVVGIANVVSYLVLAAVVLAFGSL